MLSVEAGWESERGGLRARLASAMDGDGDDDVRGLLFSCRCDRGLWGSGTGKRFAAALLELL